MTRVQRITNVVLTILITLGTLLLGVFFYRASYLRLWESLRDLGRSVRFYVLKLFGKTELPEVSVTAPSEAIPWDVKMPVEFDAFIAPVKQFWTTFFSPENRIAFQAAVAHTATVIAKAAAILLPCLLALILLVRHL